MNKNSNERPLIIAVETSGRKGSVALAEGENLLEQCDFSEPMRHSAELLPCVEKLVSRFGKNASQISQVYISIGPGSFTGLRIAVTFAKTLNLANSAKIVTVKTSDVIASNVINSNIENNSQYEKLATILDAKRGQFFVAVYSNYEKILPDCLMTAEQFKEQFASLKSPTYLLGEGLVYYKDKFRIEGIEFLDEKYWWPKAENVYRLGWQKALKDKFEDPLKLQPFYLRQPQLGISKLMPKD